MHSLVRNMCLTQCSPTLKILHLFDGVVVLMHGDWLADPCTVNAKTEVRFRYTFRFAELGLEESYGAHTMSLGVLKYWQDSSAGRTKQQNGVSP